MTRMEPVSANRDCGMIAMDIPDYFVTIVSRQSLFHYNDEKVA